MALAKFTASKTGKTGLSVTCDIDEYVLGTDTVNSHVTGAGMTEVRNGIYRYFFNGDDGNLYDVTAKTADATVDDQQPSGIIVLLHRLGNLDALISSRLATAGYTAPLSAAGVRTAVGLASANLDTQLGAIDDYLDTEIAAVKAKTDNLPASPAATGDAMTLTSGERSTLATAIWSATTRTLSSLGSLVADVWAYAIRTLTTPAQTAETQATAGTLEIVRGVTWYATLTSVAFPATWVACLFTVKGPGYEDDADDSGALVQIRLSKPAVGGDGLIRLGGAAATAAQGSITADEAGGGLTLVLNDEATIELASRTGLSYDVKFLLAAGSSVRERIGSLAVVATPTVTRG